MPFSVTQLPDENVVIVKHTAPFDPNTDLAGAQARVGELLEQVEGTLWRVEDISAAEMSFGAFAAAMQIATSDGPGSMRNPRLKGVLVGTDEIVKMASDSIKQAQYGAIEMPAFASQAEALAYIRKQGE